ncbi:hypothetical protein CYMTET_25275 [Cymbomonas tetramitiformis]|uniref:Uncharacterized protein n=1 Tax=Cymbomonas tetramitiformis TaxID=36881 RepID=A0AAE0FU12_9CHLO|nr:hypothetical protein CYMTET_25275 [Cymbomonas tetramitiformis]
MFEIRFQRKSKSIIARKALNSDDWAAEAMVEEAAIGAAGFQRSEWMLAEGIMLTMTVTLVLSGRASPCEQIAGLHSSMSAVVGDTISLCIERLGNLWGDDFVMAAFKQSFEMSANEEVRKLLKENE